MPELVLGPLLRYVGEREATIWVEADSPCEVSVLGRRTPTFCVDGHHYALVAVRDLEPGRVYEYDVHLGDRRCWPPDTGDQPPSSIRTIDPARSLRLNFGSCRVSVPHEPPYTLTKDEDDRGREIDALYALAQQLRERPRAEWPDLLLMLGDQVYVDEDAPQTRAFIRARRDTGTPPGEGVADFEEYTRLYREAWGDTTLRWLLSTVSTAMIFDDHDVHDDWNTSAAWLEEMEHHDWWHERMTAALMAYWLYQHLGNLSPDELDGNEMFARVRGTGDGGADLRRHARDWDHHRNGSRWSHARLLGRTKLVMLDSREGRHLEEGERRMFDDAEWDWICREVSGDFDHVVLADTLPVLMPPAFHHIEAWNEAVCAGAWGRAARWLLGERLRRAVDLEHWAAFQSGFVRMSRLLGAIARGDHGPAPATIVLLAGDIHHAYLAEVALPRSVGARSAVYQAVCSPFRNPLDRHERLVARFGSSRVAGRIMHRLARLAGVPDPPIRWRLTEPPTFDNQFGTLELEGRRARVRIERTLPGTWPRAQTEVTLDRELA
ncbi:MAG: alkaline phosphatase family protein [Solirubrobacterales bacterium]|nr:alkaline phosphatase family protein [Solirubrobacterales bacterium]